MPSGEYCYWLILKPGCIVERSIRCESQITKRGGRSRNAEVLVGSEKNLGGKNIYSLSGLSSHW